MGVSLSGARFLSPSLGKPSFLSKHDRDLTAFVVAKKGCLDAKDIEDSFFLRPVRYEGSSLLLETTQITEVSDIIFNPHMRKILPPKKHAYYKVTLKWAGQEDQSDPQNRRFVLYDLCHPRIDTGFHAVALRYRYWESIRICFISDVHVAEIWDSLQSDFSGLPENQTKIDTENIFELSRAFSGPVYSENYINPNKNLVHFIKTSNQLAEKNELDLIIMGGDLVDTKFKHKRQHGTTSFEDTNYKLLEDILTGKYDPDVELKVPLFTVTGNHDYRLYPYSIRNYGLDRCGIHELLKVHYLSKKRKKTGKRLSLQDLDTIRDKKGKNHSLNHYFIHFNPNSDYDFYLNATRFVFVDSGRDAFLNLARTHILRLKNFVKAIFASWYFPDSEGLSDEQIDLLRKDGLDSTSPENMIVVFHAGLINTSFESDAIVDGMIPITLHEYLPEQDSLRVNVAFENLLKKRGLNFGCLFKNQLKLLALSCKPGLNFLGLSGHSHRNLEVKINKKQGTLQTGDYTGAHTNPFEEDTSYFLSSNSLGHIQSRYHAPQFPGFYQAHIQDDKIVNIQRTKLDAFPLNAYLFFARLTDQSKSKATIEVLPEVLTTESNNERENVRLIVTFLVGIRKGATKEDLFPLEINPRRQENVIVSSSKPLSVKEEDEFAVKKNIGCTYSFLCTPNPKIQFDVHQKDNMRRSYNISIIGEYIQDSPEGFQALRLCWHPVSIDLSFELH